MVGNGHRRRALGVALVAGLAGALLAAAAGTGGAAERAESAGIFVARGGAVLDPPPARQLGRADYARMAAARAAHARRADARAVGAMAHVGVHPVIAAAARARGAPADAAAQRAARSDTARLAVARLGDGGVSRLAARTQANRVGLAVVIVRAVGPNPVRDLALSIVAHRIFLCQTV